MTDKIISLRIETQEHQALKQLAAQEVRTVNGWLRARIVQAAREAGLLAEQDQRKEMQPCKI